MKRLIAAVLIGLLIVLGCTLLGGPRVQPGLADGYYRVLRVVDGDTIVLDNVGRCRLADIDAPEPDEPGGPEAKAALAEQIEGKAIYIEFVRTKAGQPAHGYYGRPLVRLK